MENGNFSKKIWETIITTNTEKRQVIAARGFLETQITTTEMERRLATVRRTALEIQIIKELMGKRKDIKAKGGFKLSGFDSPRVPRSSAAVRILPSKARLGQIPRSSAARKFIMFMK